MARKKIDPDSHVEVLLTLREREFLLSHTFAGPNLTERLQLATVAGTKLAVGYTLDELDELLGYIAAEANHTEDEGLQGELDALYERVQEKMESYDDGSWQEAF